MMQPIKHEDIALLSLDHPGANDPKYRERRNYIAQLARNFLKDPTNIPIVPYSAEENQTWQTAVTKLIPLHQKNVSVMHIKARNKLGIPTDRVPQLKDLSEKLRKLQGFELGFDLGPVEGLIDSRSFLAMLGKRRMFCTQYIRHASRPDYTPEPDIIHEVIGHVPAFTDRDMVDFSVLVGKIAAKASPAQLIQLERLYWFTIEFGLIEEDGKTKAFGAGLLSSFGELQHCFTSQVERKPFQLQEVLNTPYDYSQMQKKLFVFPSFSYIRKQTETLFADLIP